MGGFLLRRLAGSVATILLASLVIFVLIRLVGDPTHLMLPPEATDDDRALLRQELGLDRPMVVQYATFLFDLLRGDMGESFSYRQPALPLVISMLPPSLMLAGAAMLMAVALGVPWGLLAAYRPDGWADRTGRVFAVLGQSGPPFFVGLLLIRLLSVNWRLLPTSGYGDVTHLVMPAFALSWYSAAGLLRLTRASVTEALRSDYILTARIKGVSDRAVLLRHALRNAALPIITFTSSQFGILLGSAVSIEAVFAWPGFGKLIVDAISQLDYTVVQAGVVVAAVLFIAINLCTDILCAALDPRIRLGS
jgi:peptide/nickel transport system permease protein